MFLAILRQILELLLLRLWLHLGLTIDHAKPNMNRDTASKLDNFVGPKTKAKEGAVHANGTVHVQAITKLNLPSLLGSESFTFKKENVIPRQWQQ